MAGFEVITYGRFWVTAKAKTTSFRESTKISTRRPTSSSKPLEIGARIS
jgi:hypothetical protein